MRRIVQVARSLQLAAQTQTGQPIQWAASRGSFRPFTISSVALERRHDDQSFSNKSGKKRGLLERAGDKLSEMSGMKSQPDGDTSMSSTRQTRSMRKNDSSGRTDQQRAGESDGRDASKRAGRTTDHRAMSSVRHEKESHRFVLDLGGNQIARIDYKPAGKNMIEMYHTEVPEQLRGRGIGKALAKGALESAMKANLKLKVTCEYLEDYVKRFADEKHRKLVIK